MDAAQLVDHAIRECYIKSRPAYITLPTDMVGKKVEGKRLEKPLDLRYPDNDPAQEDYAVENIMKHLQVAKKPIILVDACAIRHRAMDETQKLVEQSGLPTFVTPMGKGAINETLPNYSGVYAGNGSHQDVQDMVESSDLILSIGAIKSDFNTAGFTYHTSQLSSIDFHSSYVQVKYSEYHGLRMNGVLNKITQKLSTFKLSVQPSLKPTNEVDPKEDKSQDTTITHSWLWPKFGQWVRDDDVIVTETGTSGYGIWEVKFKRGVRAISQILWGSIGYATGAAQGAALAAQEQKKGRTILFTGDGSFQLTAQELSTMIRKRLNPIVFIICNDGFTIERFIHGMDATYNDIAAWKYKDLPAVFNAQPGEYKTYQVKTKSDMQKLLSDEDFATSKCLRLVELYMRKDDAPKALVMTAEASAKNNARLD
ncbi:MAG: Pyruvate decarboxylase 1 [Chrysothrix sp. TS-e1954]|nr:MAG: Pyruvate decarboxylase 1 [Chrysothrix sp. TS-e1954]